MLAAAGTLFVLGALAIFWAARSTVDRSVYVSQLGAEGEPTARAFMAALLLISGGGALIAWAARGVRARARILRLWTPAASLAAASVSFVGASQITCTPGCPLPIQPGFFSFQDLAHISLAVAGFALACWAMLQCASAVATTREVRISLARISLAASLAVALIAGAGGLMSVFGFYRGIGAWLEFLAMTIALLWVTVLGLILALRQKTPSEGSVLENSVLQNSVLQNAEQLVGE